MFGAPRGIELLVILVLFLLIFGRKLPEMGRSLGRGIVEFKRGLKGIKEETDDVDHEVAEPRGLERPTGSLGKADIDHHDAPENVTTSGVGEHPDRVA